ncbi:unnamed protein product, partial [Mesorhabditis spiculigera]
FSIGALLLQVSIAYGAKVFPARGIVPTLVEAVASKIEDRSIVAKKVYYGLAKRYGPVGPAPASSSNYCVFMPLATQILRSLRNIKFIRMLLINHCTATQLESGVELCLAGNRRFIQPLLSSAAFDSGGSLSNLWCARVSAAVCGSGTKHVPRFDQITLCTFSGHSGAIRRIESLSNENSFVTTSSDKTVKLWSIRHDQETSQCQWTYKGHSGTVRDVRLLASGLIASTDGYLH